MILPPRILLLAVPAILSFAKPTLAKCCFSFSSSQVLLSTYNASVVVASQLALDSPGMLYKATVIFPSDQIINTLPNGCTRLNTMNAVNCTSSGLPRLSLTFLNLTRSSGQEGQGTEVASSPSLDSLLTNGEYCTAQSTCPVLSRTPPPEPSSENNNNKSMIIGVSCAVGVVVLLVGLVVLRRNMTSASSVGVQRKNSQYSIRHGQSQNHGQGQGRVRRQASYGGSYEDYREKTLRRQKSVREFHQAVAANSVAQEAILQRSLSPTPRMNDYDLSPLTAAHTTESTSLATSGKIIRVEKDGQELEMSMVDIPTATLFGDDDLYFLQQDKSSVGSPAQGKDDSLQRNISAKYPWASAAETTAKLHRAASAGSLSRHARLTRTSGSGLLPGNASGSGSGVGSSSSALSSDHRQFLPFATVDDTRGLEEDHRQSH